MKRVVLIAGILAVVADLAIAVYMAVLVFVPVRALTVMGEDAVLNPGKTVVAGQALIYQISYCKYTQRQAAVTRSLDGPVSYPLPPSTNNIPVGCTTAVSRNTIIPIGVEPGVYHLDLQATYQINPLRSISVSSRTEDFTVLAPTTQSLGDADSGSTVSSTSSATPSAPEASPPATVATAPTATSAPSPSPSPGLFTTIINSIKQLF